MKQNTPLLVESNYPAAVALESLEVDKSIDNEYAYNSIDHDISHITDDHDEFNEDNTSNAKISIKNKLLGILCCIISIISWIAAANVVKEAQDGSGDNDDEFHKPFFLMYFSCAAYISLFIVWFSIKLYSKHENKWNDFYRMFKLLSIPSIFLAFFNLFVQFTWADSLNETMVSVNTAIYQSGVAFVYIFSVMFLGMKVTLKKITGVIVCIFGVLTISYGAYNEEINSDSDDVVHNSIKGIITVGISVLLNSIFIVGIEYVSNKYFDQDHGAQYMVFLQSLIGLFILLVYWPIFFIFHELNIEKFAMPSTNNQWMVVFWTIITTFCFFGGFFMGVVFTNAMFVSVVILFVLPLGYFSDIIIYSYDANIWAYIGTVLIVIGFLIMEISVKQFKCKKKTKTIS